VIFGIFSVSQEIEGEHNSTIIVNAGDQAVLIASGVKDGDSFAALNGDSIRVRVIAANVSEAVPMGPLSGFEPSAKPVGGVGPLLAPAFNGLLADDPHIYIM
jgi:hypothetical protein